MSASAPLPGTPFPLGATAGRDGTNFAVASGVADGVDLCLFDEAGAETRVPLRDFDAGVWHGFLPGVGPGQGAAWSPASRSTGPTRTPVPEAGPLGRPAVPARAGGKLTAGPRTVVVLRSPRPAG